MSTVAADCGPKSQVKEFILYSEVRVPHPRVAGGNSVFSVTKEAASWQDQASSGRHLGEGLEVMA